MMTMQSFAGPCRAAWRWPAPSSAAASPLAAPQPPAQPQAASALLLAPTGLARTSSHSSSSGDTGLGADAKRGGGSAALLSPSAASPKASDDCRAPRDAGPDAIQYLHAAPSSPCAASAAAAWRRMPAIARVVAEEEACVCPSRPAPGAAACAPHCMPEAWRRYDEHRRAPRRPSPLSTACWPADDAAGAAAAAAAAQA